MKKNNDPSNVTKEWATEHFNLAEEIKGVWMRMLENPLKVFHEMDGTKIDNDVHLSIYLQISYGILSAYWNALIPDIARDVWLFRFLHLFETSHGGGGNFQVV